MKNYRGLIAASVMSVLCVTGFAQSSKFTQINSRSQYVHRIPLLDADKRPITMENQRPYSSANTCGKCHDYKTISHGFHFNAIEETVVDAEGDAEVKVAGSGDGRRGTPWMLTDARSGTQVPVSYRDWAGTYKPDVLGLDAWGFVKAFGGRIPGGGPGEVHGEEGEDSRWKVAGSLDVDCMICHSRGTDFKIESWADQIGEENFAWASTVAAGLAEVKGNTERLPVDYDVKADPDGKAPVVTYEAARFDAENKVFVDVIRKPNNDSCYRCHSTRPVGEDAAPKWMHDGDVHLRAGFDCADCHRNGIAHNTVRGFEGEEHASGISIKTLSCAGCHLGVADEDGHIVELGGRLGAPEPMHDGIPPIHFDTMSCTSCHSGPVAGAEAGHQQTGLTHLLGLPSHDRNDEMAPGIVAPVFARGEDGKIAPHRAVWPAFWGRMNGEEVTPVDLEEAYQLVRKIFRVRSDFVETIQGVRLSSSDKAEALGEDRKSVSSKDYTEDEVAKLAELTATRVIEGFDENLAKALDAMGDEGGTGVYVSGGMLYQLGADGKVVSSEHESAAAYLWPIGHDVRPARQSLGVGGCLECHNDASPIFHGKFAALGPAPVKEAVTNVMWKVQGQDPLLMQAWQESFKGRAIFKKFAIGALVVLVGIVFLGLLWGVSGLLGGKCCQVSSKDNEGGTA